MELVIIGNGVAGTTAARLVSDKDPSTKIRIYSREPHPYYPRPSLIPLLAGETTVEEIIAYPAKWYQERNIQAFLDEPVQAIRPEDHEIVLSGGETVTYDALILASGAHAWTPPIPGKEKRGVHTLRTLDDALTLLEKTKELDRAIVLGGGLLGLDTATAMCKHGMEVLVVEILPRLLPRQLDVEGARLLQKLMEEMGLQVLTGEQCESIEGNEAVERIRLKSGRTIETSMVVVSAGIRSNIELAQEAGLACNRGVLVDERLRTSDQSIYAIGDVAEFNETIWGIIPAALAQARVAAAQITGNEETVYEDIVPSTTLKVAGIQVISIGEVNPSEDGYLEQRRIDEDEGTYSKLTVRDGRITGAILVNERSKLAAINQLVRRGVDVSDHMDCLLGDEFDLRDLL